jgi:hypothetical protein
MTRTSKRDRIRDVVKHYEHCYGKRLDAPLAGGIIPRHTLAQLRALDLDHCTEADVAAAIGNDSWTSNRCDECGRDNEVVVTVGEPPDYESRTASLCPECLAKALQLATPNAV